MKILPQTPARCRPLPSRPAATVASGPALSLKSRADPGGFTLLEIMLAVAILAVATTVTYMSFSAVATAWRRSQNLSKDIHRADYVMDQLEMGLRSSYYSDATCGFWLEDGGDGAGSADKISWVKLGSALVGADCPFLGTPHRVTFFLEDASHGKAAAITAYQLRRQSDDFNPEEDLEPILLSKGIVGFNCRPQDPLATGEEIEWMDEWEDTNKIPRVVELTLYMEPLDEDGDTVEIKRIVEIPVAPLAWGGQRTATPGTSTPAADSRSAGRSDPAIAPSRSRLTAPVAPPIQAPGWSSQLPAGSPSPAGGTRR